MLTPTQAHHLLIRERAFLFPFTAVSIGCVADVVRRSRIEKLRYLKSEHKEEKRDIIKLEIISCFYTLRLFTN